MSETIESQSADLPVSAQVAATEFVHPSERVAAQILDFYRIRWEYEPTRFPIEWDGEGDVIAYFAPDFYLTDLDLYIELTTMNQKLVTKKNRKVRRLKELYPDVNIKIFYQKDFRKLLFKFGIPVEARPHNQGGGLTAREEDRS
jgi:hypoxanthine phosphoribosyltransferase